MFKYLIATVFLSLHGLASGDDDGDQTDKIIDKILTDYKPKVRAVDEDEKGVKLSLTVAPLHVYVDATTSTLHSHVWFQMSWNDKRLTWNSRSYGGVTQVHLGPDTIWRPDIMVYNSVEHFDYDNVDILVDSLGNCYWYPPANFHTSCDLDWTYWPWDIQQCHLVVGSWTKTGGEIDIQNHYGGANEYLEMSHYKPGAWDLIGGSQRKQIFNYTTVVYVDIDVTLVLQRRSLLDKKVAVMPLLAAASLLLATFWTHPAASSRLRLNAFVCLILVVTLLGLRSMLPSAGGNLPHVVVFNAGLVVLAVIQLIVALSLANLVARWDSPPLMLTSFLQGPISTVLCLSDIPLLGQVPSSVIPPWSSNGDVERTEEGTSKKKPEFTGWNLLAQAVDRVCFIVYVFIIVCFMCSYIGGAMSFKANNEFYYNQD